MTMACKRVLLVIFLLITVFWTIFAEESSGLLEVQTEHFLIIYDKDTEDSAAVIASVCEDSYDYLVSLFKTDPQLNFPVILTSDTKMLNANFSTYPTNRIFLYDVVAEKGSLTNFPETLSYIFRHELTHAFTINFRSSFWQVLANIFADSVSISNVLYSYQSLTEGIAVAVESLDGYGRMNDYLSTRVVRQAKIEDSFPSWIAICGARDTYPSSLLPYIFGGAFLTYLCDTYGTDKVCEIFVRFGKINWFKDTTGIIESVIGVKMKVLWQDFYESIEVPGTLVTGQSVEGYKKEGSFSEFKALSDGSIMFFDEATYSLYKLSSDLSTSSKVLSNLTYASSYDVSDDGLLLIPLILENSNCVQIKTQDGKILKTFNYDDRDVRGGAFIKDGLVLYTSKAQETFLEVYNSNYELLETISLGYGAVASGFANLEDTRLAFILTQSASDNIVILNTSDMSLELYENPTSMRLYNLALSYETSEKLLSFCWVPTAASEENNGPILGGYGEFNPDDGSFRLSKVDVTGGVNYPVRLKNTVLYSSSLYEGDVINSISIDALSLEDSVITSHSTFVAKAFDSSKLEALSNSKAYNPFNHMSDGTLLPLGSYFDGSTGVGLTWSALDPTQTFGFNFSGLYNETGFSLGLWGVANASLGSVSLPITAGSLFSEDHITLSLLAQPSYSFYFDAGKAITVSDQAYYSVFFYKQGVLQVFTNSFALSYVSATSTGLGINDSLGYKITFGLTNLNPSLTAKVVIPFYVPISLTVSGLYDVASSSFVASGEGKLTFVSVEVQDGTRILGLYVKRFVVDALYNCAYAVFQDSFNQTITLRAYTEFAPLIGMLASSLDFKLGVKLVWNPADGSPKFSVAFFQ